MMDWQSGEEKSWNMILASSCRRRELAELEERSRRSACEGELAKRFRGDVTIVKEVRLSREHLD